MQIYFHTILTENDSPDCLGPHSSTCCSWSPILLLLIVRVLLLIVHQRLQLFPPHRLPPVLPRAANRKLHFFLVFFSKSKPTWRDIALPSSCATYRPPCMCRDNARGSREPSTSQLSRKSPHRTRISRPPSAPSSSRWPWFCRVVTTRLPRKFNVGEKVPTEPTFYQLAIWPHVELVGNATL